MNYIQYCKVGSKVLQVIGKTITDTLKKSRKNAVKALGETTMDFTDTSFNPAEYYKNIEKNAYKRYILTGDPNSVYNPFLLVTPDLLGIHSISYSSSINNVIDYLIIPRAIYNRPHIDAPIVARDTKKAAGNDFYIYPQETFNNAGWSKYAGFYFPNTNNIALKAGNIWALPHEIRHKIDNYILLTEEEKSILTDAFGNDFIEAVKTLNLPDLQPKNIPFEYVTTNLDSRIKLLGKPRISLVELNKIIDNASDNDIINAVEGSNGYGRAFIDYLRKNNKLTPERIKALKYAMKMVPSITGLTVSSLSLVKLDNNPQNNLNYLSYIWEK